MRLLSLLVVVSVTLCYSGICSAAYLITDGPEDITSHCHTDNHDTVDSTKNYVTFNLDTNTVDTEVFDCCLDGLINTSIDDNFDYNAIAIGFISDFTSGLETNNNQFLKLIFTKRPHGPPDIYLLHSSFLL